MTEGSCSLSGFTFQPKKDGDTPFTPSFPASSPWVTSVGATQVWFGSGVASFFPHIGPNPLALKASLSELEHVPMFCALVPIAQHR